MTSRFAYRGRKVHSSLPHAIYVLFGLICLLILLHIFGSPCLNTGHSINSYAKLQSSHWFRQNMFRSLNRDLSFAQGARGGIFQDKNFVRTKTHIWDETASVSISIELDIFWYYTTLTLTGITKGQGKFTLTTETPSVVNWFSQHLLMSGTLEPYFATFITYLHYMGALPSVIIYSFFIMVCDCVW